MRAEDEKQRNLSLCPKLCSFSQKYEVYETKLRTEISAITVVFNEMAKPLRVGTTLYVENVKKNKNNGLSSFLSLT